MIILNNKWALVSDQLNWMPYLWNEQKEYKCRQTGEHKLSEAKWKSIGRYYPNIYQALKGIQHYEMHELAQEATDFSEFIAKLEELETNLLEVADKIAQEQL